MRSKDPQQYGSVPVLGNYTDCAESHLWCAQALANLIASPEQPLGNFNEDLQSALRYLLRCEVVRAQKAAEAEQQKSTHRRAA